MSRRMRTILMGGAALAALGLVGAAIAIAGPSPSGESSIPSESHDGAEAPEQGENVRGSAAEQAKAVALRATGGGHANAVDRDSEKGATWEVEVTTQDGSTVDVRLDESYHVVVIEGDAGG